MYFSTSFVAAAVAFLSAAGTVNAHLKIDEPKPFNADSLNNSPLEANGSDFPCKKPENGKLEPPAEPSSYKVGEKMTVSIVGSAVHGGGSCQFSVTDDKNPGKDTVWKVIHSIEGGCPVKADGNLGNSPGNKLPPIEFTIPDSLAPGEYTFAWTWFNRIGNREMYMNCAPITINQPARKRYMPTPRTDPRSLTDISKRADFPDMFVANIGNGCTTKEGVDIRFPNPGEFVELLGDPAKLLGIGEPVCDGKSGGPVAGGPEGGNGGDGGNGGGDGGDGGSQPAPSPSSSPSGKPGGFFPKPSQAPAPSSSSSPAPTQPAQQPAPTPPSDGGGNDGGNDGGSDGGSGGGSAKSGACEEEGMFNCIGGSQFQQCASGKWTVPMQMATGTTCSSGMNKNLNIAAAAVKPRGIGARHARIHH